MKIAKIILSIVTMLFALLGLLKVISFDIANPIMSTIITAIFLYVVVIYNVFIA